MFVMCQEIKPVAMLCGHAAPIADLGICFPTVNSGDGQIGYLSDVLVNSDSAVSGALISACTDGVLCVWSRDSGHCRRRRKMPPWVGSPSVVRALPKNPRYVCVAACFVDSVHLFDHQSLESSEGGEAAMDRDPQNREPSKCTVAIVDSYTLTVVQTIFHGNLQIGPLRFMAIVPPVEGTEKQSVLLGDTYGKLQRVSMLKEPNSDSEKGTALHKNSYNFEMTDWAEDSSEGLQVLAFDTSGQVLAHVYRTFCIFRLAVSGCTIGEISFVNNLLCFEEGSAQLHVIGGVFLASNARRVVGTRDRIEENFAVWNNRGFAVVYRITYSDSIFSFELLSVLPDVDHPIDDKLSICFVQLGSYLIRIESICFHVEEPLLWKPYVTTWLLPQQCDKSSNLRQECKMLAEGRFFVDWVASSTSPNETAGLHDTGIKLAGRDKVDSICATDGKYWFCKKERIISSSMVISESYYTPYAVVYGFHTGEIEVVRFNIFVEGFESDNRSHGHETDSNVSKQSFSGHTGAVLCLAAHRMVGRAKGWRFNRVLVSGSMDCTIRIWDLDSGKLITVMHHHVAPVCQIILPPPQTDRPWNDCFLSVGEDSCVALVSLETLRVERMFPGHPYRPAKVTWDGRRGYLACLCQNHSGASDALDILYIWDVKTGARERVLRGTASHSMFDHFSEGVNTISTSSGVLHGNTSASSLLLPLVEDGKLSRAHSKKLGKGASSSNTLPSITSTSDPNASLTHSRKGNSTKLFSVPVSILQSNKHPINCSCPFPGIAGLSFDLALLMSLCQKHEILKGSGENQGIMHMNEHAAEMPKNTVTIRDESGLQRTSTNSAVNDDWVQSLELCLLQFSLSFLHLWDVDIELDKLLMTEMKVKRPENFLLASGLQGDRGSLTLTFPGSRATLEVHLVNLNACCKKLSCAFVLRSCLALLFYILIRLKVTLQLWKSSSEFSAMRSLTMVSLAQHMISWSHSCSASSR